jgi:hypothetical protein
MPIRRLPLADVLADLKYREAINAITAESYTNPEVLLEQEFHKNNVAYLWLDPQGVMLAFFLVGWSNTVVSGEELECVFLGLSAVRRQSKGGAIAISLYRSFFRDADELARETGRPVAWWFHTASPIVAGVMWRIMPETAPSPTGVLTDRQSVLLEAVSKQFAFTPFQDQVLPFVLRGLAKARYNPNETDRLATREARQASPLNDWKIREMEGDRVLFVGYSKGGE